MAHAHRHVRVHTQANPHDETAARGAPAKELGLRLLPALVQSVQAQSVETNNTVLAATADLLEGVAPLRMFSDVCAHLSVPEDVLVFSEAQVSADSTRTGGSYGVSSLILPLDVPGAASKYWCSKARPTGDKSVLVFTFKAPAHVTGLTLTLPKDDTLHPDLVGVEYLTAEAGVATAAQIASQVARAGAPGSDPASSGAGAHTWQVLGVVKASATGSRIPFSAHGAVALRVSMKGFHEKNVDKYHALSSLLVTVAAKHMVPGVGGVATFTDARDVLTTLESWMRTSATSSDAALLASVRALSGLALSTGALTSVLSLIHVLMKHASSAALPPAVAHAVRTFVHRADAQFDRIAAVVELAATAVAGVARVDRFDECAFTDKSSSVRVDAAGKQVWSDSSPEYAALNIGISSGRMVWEMKIVEDSADGECQCFGICKKPVTNNAYDASKDMWMWRAYNGCLYEMGSTRGTKAKFHPNDIIRFELDMDAGELRAWRNEEEQGVLFKDLNKKGWTIYPCVQFYSSGRSASILSCKVYDAAAAPTAVSASGVVHASADVAVPQVYVCDMAEVVGSVTVGGTLGKRGLLGATADGTADAPQLRTTLHGVPVTRGLVTPLSSGTANATASVAYKVGGDDKGEKAKKKGKATTPAPVSQYTVFEAVVGLADYVRGETSGFDPLAGAAAPVAPAAAAATGTHAEDDEDSKMESSMQYESKEADAVLVPVAAATRPAVAASVAAPVISTLPDVHPTTAEDASTITFVVKGDGKELWRSPALRVPAEGLPTRYAAHARVPVHHCIVSVASISKLELCVLSEGKTTNAFPVWGDARLRNVPWGSERAAFEADMALTGTLPQNAVVLAGVHVPSVPADIAADLTLPSAASVRPYPLASLVASCNTYTTRLAQEDVDMTGSVGAAAVLRVLRLLAREAYKPVRVTRSAPAPGQAHLPLEVPFAVQADFRGFRALAATLTAALDALLAAPASSTATTLQAESASTLLSLLKLNLRRVVASHVLPSELGIGAHTHATGDAHVLSDLKVQLQRVLDAGVAGTVPQELAADAADVLDTGLQLFYPTHEAQQAFLNDLLGSGEGGVLEVNFAWPTASAAAGGGSKDGTEASGSAGGGADTDATATGGDSKGTSSEKAAATSDSGMRDGSDPRFERAILMLQTFASRRGWAHTTVGTWGRFLHLIISIPDTAEAPVVETLSSGLHDVLASAGLKGWRFPVGCSSPEITFKIERFLQVDRRARLATEAGVGWIRLYPRRIATLQDVVSQVQAFLASYDTAPSASAAGGDAAAAASATKPHVAKDVFGDEIGGEAAVAASAAASVVEEGAGRRDRARTDSTHVEEESSSNTDEEEGDGDDDDEAEDDEEESGTEEEEEEDEGMGGLFD